MRKSEITAEFTSDIQTVWNIVTDYKDYSWRSDLSKIEPSSVHAYAEDNSTFTEYTKDGFRTTFTITKKLNCSLYEFDMQNANFTGHWTGVFSKTANNGTKIVFTELIVIKNPVMELLSYLFMNLKKMQRTYVRDLKQKLGEL